MHPRNMDRTRGPGTCHTGLQGGGTTSHPGYTWRAGHILQAVPQARIHNGQWVWAIYQTCAAYQPAHKRHKRVPTSDVFPSPPWHNRSPCCGVAGIGHGGTAAVTRHHRVRGFQCQDSLTYAKSGPWSPSTLCYWYPHLLTCPLVYLILWNTCFVHIKRYPLPCCIYMSYEQRGVNSWLRAMFECILTAYPHATASVQLHWPWLDIHDRADEASWSPSTKAHRWLSYSFPSQCVWLECTAAIHNNLPMGWRHLLEGIRHQRCYMETPHGNAGIRG